ncbi:MAG TPA: hypothetical protein VGE29_20530 [Prosthecobacter sp.]
MRTHSSKRPAEASRWTWMASGAAMFLLGFVLLFTITLTAVGILLMIAGVGSVMAAYIRSEQPR